MYSFLTTNNFIEHNIQKGFTPNVSGTPEHTAQMANIINKARNQKTLTCHHPTSPQKCFW